MGGQSLGERASCFAVAPAIENNLPRKGTSGMGAGVAGSTGGWLQVKFPCLLCGLGFSPFHKERPLPKGLSWEEARGLWEGMFVPFPVCLINMTLLWLRFFVLFCFVFPSFTFCLPQLL